MYKIVKLGQLLILKVYICLFIFICKCKNRSKIRSLGIVTLYIQCQIFNSNRVKDTKRLYQNGLILHLERENQDFDIKINMYILLLI